MLSLSESLSRLLLGVCLADEWSSAILRKICLMIFPEHVFGSPGTTCMEGRGGRRGY